MIFDEDIQWLLEQHDPIQVLKIRSYSSWYFKEGICRLWLAIHMKPDYIRLKLALEKHADTAKIIADLQIYYDSFLKTKRDSWHPWLLCLYDELCCSLNDYERSLKTERIKQIKADEHRFLHALKIFSMQSGCFSSSTLFRDSSYFKIAQPFYARYYQTLSSQGLSGFSHNKAFALVKIVKLANLPVLPKEIIRHILTWVAPQATDDTITSGLLDFIGKLAGLSWLTVSSEMKAKISQSCFNAWANAANATLTDTLQKKEIGLTIFNFLQSPEVPRYAIKLQDLAKSISAHTPVPQPIFEQLPLKTQQKILCTGVSLCLGITLISLGTAFTADGAPAAILIVFLGLAACMGSFFQIGGNYTHIQYASDEYNRLNLIQRAPAKFPQYIAQQKRRANESTGCFTRICCRP